MRKNMYEYCRLLAVLVLLLRYMTCKAIAVVINACCRATRNLCHQKGILDLNFVCANDSQSFIRLT